MNYGNSAWLIEGKKFLVNNYIASTQKKKKNLFFVVLLLFLLYLYLPTDLSLWYRVKEMGGKMKQFEREEEGI